MREATLGYLLDGDKVLLGLKKSGFGLGKWNGCGGKIESGETVEDSLIREVKEEVGVTISGFDKVGTLNFVFSGKPEWDQKVHIFIVTAWEGHPAESVEIKPKWFLKNELPMGEMWLDDPYWLPLVLGGSKVFGTFVFGKDNASVIDYSLIVE